jgi:formamidopyrimidine-DNA glycosylase
VTQPYRAARTSRVVAGLEWLRTTHEVVGLPELPEIEALRQLLSERVVGKIVASVAIRQFALVKTFDPPLDALIGQTPVEAGRHGKHLLLDFDGGVTLAIHLGIGGRLVPRSPGADGAARRAGGRYTSLEIGWDDGEGVDVVELGKKKRSSVHVLPSSGVPAHLSSLGVDALSPELTVERLGALLSAERAQLKHFLVDQHRIAGIGNAYSDEILWEAHLPPLRMTTTLADEEVGSLHVAIHDVLSAALDWAREENYLLVARGDKRGNFQVHRREGEPCPRCGEAIASIHLAESSLQYCPACQLQGRRYADRRLSRLFR